jgi:hypothetical protein
LLDAVNGWTYSLNISFLYQGLPTNVTRDYHWTDGNRHFLIIDKTNEGLLELLDSRSKELLEVFTQNKSCSWYKKEQKRQRRGRKLRETRY